MNITDVRDHFHRTAREFDDIYSGRKNIIARRLDWWLRWDMYERFRLTMEECSSIEGKKILDIGTGSGRFLFPLVDRNPQQFLDIPRAKPEDFQKATQRISRSSSAPSKVSLFVID